MNYVHREWIALPASNSVVTIDEEGNVEHVIARSVSMSDINKIAASNEMYEALKMLWRYSTIHTVEGVIYPEGSHSEWIEKANKALLKAEENND